MIRQGVILGSGWMKNTKYGLATSLALIPETEGWDAGQLAAVMPKAIYDEEQDECILSDEGPSKLPALVVVADSDPNLESEVLKPGQIAQDFVLAFLYVTDQEVPEMLARYRGHLIGRAVRYSLTRWNVPQFRKAEGLDMLEGVKMVKIDSMTEQRVIGKIGRSALKGAVLATLQFMDTKV